MVYAHPVTYSQGKFRQDPKKFFKKGAWPGSRDPLNFWALNANNSKMTKDTNFTFGTHAPGESTDMTPEKCFRKGGVARVM